MSETFKFSDEAEGFFALATVLLLPAWLAWSGYAMSWLWLWFAVPLGLPPLGTAHAAGLGLLVTFATSRGSELKSSQVFFRDAFGPALYLGLGWCVSRWLS